MEFLATSSLRRASRRTAAFTMVEIALSLAIIGFALVAIIGALTTAMPIQRTNREQTIINQDATVFIQAIRDGARGADDLTNYVYAITNYWTVYPGMSRGVNGYTYTSSSTSPSLPINSGARIIGLLSTPQYTDPVTYVPLGSIAGGSYVSNHVVAYVHSLSGPAVEKPPQANDSIIREDSFSYRILCINAPLAATDTNLLDSGYEMNLLANLREVQLAFLWPQLPNGGLGPWHQTFRTMVAGQLATTITNNQALYFYQPQIFTKAP